MMVGMRVTATFKGGTEETLNWAATGGASGGVSGANWSLNVTGNTFTINWNLTVNASSSLTNLFIHAGTGETVFDVISNPYVSPGSAEGKKFETVYGDFLTATYSDLVGVGGTVYGDLYRTLNLGFGVDGFSNDSLSFLADTDNLKIKGDLNPANPQF